MKRAGLKVFLHKLTAITCSSATNETIEEPREPFESDTNPPKKKRKKISFMDKHRERQSTKTGTSDHNKKLQGYLEEPVEEKTCPLKYWSSNQSKHPNIAQVAVSVLGIPAS